MGLGDILSSSGAKSLPIFLTTSGILNAGPKVYDVKTGLRIDTYR